MMGMREKPRNTKTNTKTKETIPRLFALPSPVYQVEANCFPVPEKHRKQAELTLSGIGFLI